MAATYADSASLPGEPIALSASCTPTIKCGCPWASARRFCDNVTSRVFLSLPVGAPGHILPRDLPSSPCVRREPSNAGPRWASPFPCRHTRPVLPLRVADQSLRNLPNQLTGNHFLRARAASSILRCSIRMITLPAGGPRHPLEGLETAGPSCHNRHCCSPGAHRWLQTN